MLTVLRVNSRLLVLESVADLSDAFALHLQSFHLGKVVIVRHHVGDD